MVVVRVPKHDEVSLSTALDAGAAGIVIPHVESADEVRHFIKECYYRKNPFQREVSLCNLFTHSKYSPSWTAFLQPLDLYARHLGRVPVQQRPVQHAELQPPHCAHPAD